MALSQGEGQVLSSREEKAEEGGGARTCPMWTAYGPAQPGPLTLAMLFLLAQRLFCYNPGRPVCRPCFRSSGLHLSEQWSTPLRRRLLRYAST